jgi:Lipocalin-like domain
MGSVSVVGTWRLVSSDGRSSTGEVSRPYGDSPVGLLIYGADGYMSATLMRPGRSHFATGDRLRGTPEELRLASEGFLGYSGTYEIDEAQRIIVHHVTVADFPNIVGTDLVRRFTLENGALTLETPPVARAGKTWVFRLVWAPAEPSAGRGRPTR